MDAANPWKSGLEHFLAFSASLGYEEAAANDLLLPPAASRSAELVATPLPVVDVFGTVDALLDLAAIHREWGHLTVDLAKTETVLEFCDLACASSVSDRFPRMEGLQQHLATILAMKSTLLSAMQAPITDSVLCVEWEARQDFLDLVRHAQELIGNVRLWLGLAEFYRSFQFPSLVVQNNMNAVRDCLARMQQYVGTLTKNRKAFLDMVAAHS